MTKHDLGTGERLISDLQEWASEYADKSDGQMAVATGLAGLGSPTCSIGGEISGEASVCATGCDGGLADGVVCALFSGSV